MTTSWVVNSQDDEWLISFLARGIGEGRISAIYKINTDEEPQVVKMSPDGGRARLAVLPR